MARSDAVWGIDIGQCALKAVRCRPLQEGRVQADAFDYVEYPKILSQPEADPAALVHDALVQFLSRNSVRGDRVAVSVPGQSGLARFIKLPPVESKKIPNIVKYEARQQIPFALDDVVWDYQKMVGGSEEEGFALETEVGLFAMKRDQVYRSLKPFDDAGIEVDVVQLAPLAIYNFVAFDQIQNLPPPEEYDPENPPESLVVISLGTDSTDLVVTNGYRVWQRSIPIGGNHFTKALTKELKLTFATAEHLKRNAAKAEDPKALFQAMRPVFNDLLTEVQRSIGYFTNLDRRAKIGRALALGNAMKLPGLQRYLAQNLGLELARLESLNTLTGPGVIDAPAFKDNVLSFGVSYGLALQGLRSAKIKTNLLPREIVKDRMIRAKKPWAVGAAAALLLGCTIAFFGDYRLYSAVRNTDDYFKPAVDKANQVANTATDHESKYKTANDGFTRTAKVEQCLVPNREAHVRWLEMLKIIELSLPRNVGERPADIKKRDEIHLTSIVWQHVDDLSTWYTGEQPMTGQAATQPGANPMVQPADPNNPQPAPTMPDLTLSPGIDASGAPAAAGPSGPGWIVELWGHHYHNDDNSPRTSEAYYLRDTLLKKLSSEKLVVPPAERVDGGPIEFDLKKMGIGFPVLADKVMKRDFVLLDPNVAEEQDPGKAGNAQAPAVNPALAPGGVPQGAVQRRQPRFEFIVQFCWMDTPPSATPPASGEATDLTVPAVPGGPPPGVPPADAASPAVAPPSAAPPAVPPETAAPPGAPPADATQQPGAGQPGGALPAPAAPAGPQPGAGQPGAQPMPTPAGAPPANAGPAPM